jgi:hypothetical protein
MARGTLGGALDQNVWKVNLRFQIGQEMCQTGFKLRDVAANDNDAGEVIAAVDPWVQNFFRTILMTTDKLVALDVTRLHGEEGAELLYVGVTGNIAGSEAQKQPSFLAVNVALKTSLRKRYGQGRMFWPMRDEGWQDAGILNAAGIVAFNGVVGGLTAAFSGDPVTHDLLLVNSHELLPARAASGGHAARPEIPPTWYDVETVKLNTVLTAIRSRKIGIGA